MLYVDNFAISAMKNLKGGCISGKRKWKKRTACQQRENRDRSIEQRKTEVTIRDVNDQGIKQGYLLAEQGGCREEIQARISRAWIKWAVYYATKGCIRGWMPRYICTPVMRRFLLYELEYTALRNAKQKPLIYTIEMRMLRCMNGISLFDHRINDDIRRFNKL